MAAGHRSLRHRGRRSTYCQLTLRWKTFHHPPEKTIKNTRCTGGDSTPPPTILTLVTLCPRAAAGLASSKLDAEGQPEPSDDHVALALASKSCVPGSPAGGRCVQGPVVVNGYESVAMLSAT